MSERKYQNVYARAAEVHDAARGSETIDDLKPVVAGLLEKFLGKSPNQRRNGNTLKYADIAAWQTGFGGTYSYYSRGHIHRSHCPLSSRT